MEWESSDFLICFTWLGCNVFDFDREPDVFEIFKKVFVSNF